MRDVDKDGKAHSLGVNAVAVGRVVHHVAADDGLLHVVVAFVADEVDDASQLVVDDALVVLHAVGELAFPHIEHHDAFVFLYGDVVVDVADVVGSVGGYQIVHLGFLVVFPFVGYLVIDIGVEIAELFHHDFELVGRGGDFRAVEQHRFLADLLTQELLEFAVLGVSVFVVSRPPPVVEHGLDAEHVHEFLVGDGTYVGLQIVKVGIFGVHHLHLVFHQHRLSGWEMPHRAAGV